MRRSVRPSTNRTTSAALAAGVACLTAVLGLAAPANAAPHPNPGGLSATSAAQIAALQQIGAVQFSELDNVGQQRFVRATVFESDKNFAIHVINDE